MSDLISVFDVFGIETLRRIRGIDPQHIRVLRNRLFKHFRSDADALANSPLAGHLRCHTLELYRRLDSAIDGATKLLFRTESGLLIESVVLRIRSGRTTLCVSSQVGCAAACEFCATGKMGIARNLSAAEILDQILQAGQLLATENTRLDNIVFMGMGEPFHNEVNLFATLESLLAPEQFNRSPGSILVSTVGICEGMLDLSTRFPQVNLALSLHSVDQTTREQIIPLARRYPLDQLRRTAAECQRLQNREVMMEYLMLRGLNDSLDDARALATWLGDMPAHVNLIPYNPIEDAPHLVGTERAQIEEFAAALKSASIKTTIRYSLGRDIDAACGQLVRKENRTRALAKHTR